MKTNQDTVMKTTRWMKLIKGKYNMGISNTFLITGNIGDYAIPGVPFSNYLVEMMNTMGFEKIVSINFSTGSTYHYGEAHPAPQVSQESPTSGENQSPEIEIREFNMDWQQMLDDLTDWNAENPAPKTVYIIEYPEFIIPHPFQGYVDEDTKRRLIDLHKLMNSSYFLNSNHMLIMVTEARSDVHEMFMNANSRTIPVTIEFPNVEERQEMILFLKETSTKTVQWELTLDQFSKLTAGLSRVHLEDLYLLAESKGILEKSVVMRRKEELIKKEFGEVVEIFDTEGFSLANFAGQEHIKAYHREAVIEPILNGDISFVPKGILFMGPPGTGKTFFSHCLAGEANINFVEFKMSKILDKYVGLAERNLEKAFNCFKSLAPVGVFIDEIDQALQRGGDSDGNSVNKNIFGMFLSFLSEPGNRGQILWIGATNYPNKLDEALKRAGRFDKKIPFFPPTQEERKKVFEYHFGKSGLQCEEMNYELLANETDGYTQAEIENIVVKSVELAKRKKQSVLHAETVSQAMSYMISTQNNRIQEMVDIALDECNDMEFLPEKYKAEVLDRRKRGINA